jgi:hypothetical protein
VIVAHEVRLEQDNSISLLLDPGGALLAADARRAFALKDRVSLFHAFAAVTLVATSIVPV